MFSAQLALHLLLLFIVALFTCSTPCITSWDLTESESPAEQEQTSQESVINQQARARVRLSLPKMPLPVSLQQRGLTLNTQAAIAPPSGHRLSNHLMAPLRC